MSEDDAKQLLERLKVSSEMDFMQGHWDKPVNDYSVVLLAALYLQGKADSNEG